MISCKKKNNKCELNYTTVHSLDSQEKTNAAERSLIDRPVGAHVRQVDRDHVDLNVLHAELAALCDQLTINAHARCTVVVHAAAVAPDDVVVQVDAADFPRGGLRKLEPVCVCLHATE